MAARKEMPRPNSGSKVDHPPHYNQHPSGVECIDIVEHMSFNIGCAMKYLWRADHKDSDIEDMEKATWYIQREIQRQRKAKSDESAIWLESKEN